MPVSHSPLTLSTTLLIRGTGSRWAATFRAHLGVALGSVFLSGPIGLVLLAEACLQLRSGLRCLVGHRTLRSLEQWEPRGFEGRLPVHLPLNRVYFEKRSFSSSGSRVSLTQRRSAMTKGSRFRRPSKSAARWVRSSALAWQW